MRKKENKNLGNMWEKKSMEEAGLQGLLYKRENTHNPNSLLESPLVSLQNDLCVLIGPLLHSPPNCNLHSIYFIFYSLFQRCLIFLSFLASNTFFLLHCKFVFHYYKFKDSDEL